ncbi:MAG: hypothetical protein SGPRY_001208, partial [Prymnesium sp.]
AATAATQYGALQHYSQPTPSVSQQQAAYAAYYAQQPSATPRPRPTTPRPLATAPRPRPTTPRPLPASVATVQRAVPNPRPLSSGARPPRAMGVGQRAMYGGVRHFAATPRPIGAMGHPSLARGIRPMGGVMHRASAAGYQHAMLMSGARPMMMGSRPVGGMRLGVATVRQFAERKRARPYAFNSALRPRIERIEPLKPIPLEDAWVDRLSELVDLTLEPVLVKPEGVPDSYTHDPFFINETGTLGAWVPPDSTDPPAKRQAVIKDEHGDNAIEDAADSTGIVSEPSVHAPEQKEATEDEGVEEQQQAAESTEILNDQGDVAADQAGWAAAECAEKEQDGSVIDAAVEEGPPQPIPAFFMPRSLKPEANFLLRYVCEVERRATLLQQEEESKAIGEVAAIEAGVSGDEAKVELTQTVAQPEKVSNAVEKDEAATVKDEVTAEKDGSATEKDEGTAKDEAEESNQASMEKDEACKENNEVMTDGAVAEQDDASKAKDKTDMEVDEATGDEDKPSLGKDETTDQEKQLVENATKLSPEEEAARVLADPELFLEKQLERFSGAALPPTTTAEQRQVAALVLKLGQLFGMRVAVLGLMDHIPRPAGYPRQSLANIPIPVSGDKASVEPKLTDDATQPKLSMGDALEDKLASVDQGPVLTEPAGADAMVDSLPDLNKTADQAVTEGGEPGSGARVATDEANVSL